ncbi:MULTISPECIES: phosphatidate cytidylyltransferase [unclassified Modestobacter]|uniref:phosphatidate cytidylyltransferase n=1 Tax=unclassified Modestobacter TaxID=2643866 RepID=UPI0022AAD2D1|nr:MULTISPECIES: phosphatidate cytidylyltransferase [unclassified Modestobacter]MCZ2824114.1 phosphatidate cytidylyltransferase [Modestobacter sp. VKM Ac-2981]MCZ2852359.1 phosphatidate cytidylyltransferase [Modestobacter sp. VKM Ac-2982]
MARPPGHRPGPVTGPPTEGLRWDEERPDPVAPVPGDPAVEEVGREPADAPLTAVPDALGTEVTGEAPQDTPSGAPRAVGRAGRDMAAAVGVGLAMGAVVFATLLLWRPSFLVVVTAAVLISVFELSGALEKGGHRPPRTPVLVGAVVMAALAWTRGPTGLVIAFLLTVFAVLLWRLGDGPVGYLRDASAAVFVALYVPLLAGFAVLLLVPDDGGARVLTFIGTVVCSDVGGFAAGVLFGKHPLARTVSPKKSWEGLAGSVAACVLIGTLLITLVFEGPWWGGVLFGVAIAVTATLGDLGESLIKRDLGIKDMGDLLPGHGGLMDRMDSLLPSAAVAWLILSVVAPV